MAFSVNMLARDGSFVEFCGLAVTLALWSLALVCVTDSRARRRSLRVVRHSELGGGASMFRDYHSGDCFSIVGRDRGRIRWGLANRFLKFSRGSVDGRHPKRIVLRHGDPIRPGLEGPLVHQLLRSRRC